jgi:hypothetical protein
MYTKDNTLGADIAVIGLGWGGNHAAVTLRA